ncbi:cupredoxin domain-containing protein [Lentilactobacillus otakiensis]|uniref:cupredoxin domain-containing protein n=1 Tax=Lentilactobacillus otakiensis TaxID=481720 RepID=UPI00040067B0|nr:cupredoxin domain-containing protein [Lentilactobacillus otakiensis]MBZ3776229.1 cupredoxin domain-containing protein [Lentilactobacillus otakiensis]MDV3517232.1 cupredoxin domain-containing protein [Lentilactobacillus otakiensis]
MKIVVLVIGLSVIGFIGWWFFGKHEVAAENAEVTDDRQVVNVEVKGGYSPEVIILKKGVPATLNFTRKDSSSCLDRVVFSDFGINQALPQDERQAVEIDTNKPGEFQWACGMDMFHGKLVIK